MNIFMVDTNPVISAQSLVDKHVVKMILESAQLLSTAHRVLDGTQYIDSSSGRKIKRWQLHDHRETILYKATHINHPSAVWARTSVENYLWLVDHFFGLMDEYTFRYGKVHKCQGNLSYLLQSPPLALKEYNMTKMPFAMDTKYIISDNTVENYRNYYVNGKQHLFAWTKRDKPTWII